MYFDEVDEPATESRGVRTVKANRDFEVRSSKTARSARRRKSGPPTPGGIRQRRNKHWSW